jgi:hypothetical protein
MEDLRCELFSKFALGDSLVISRLPHRYSIICYSCSLSHGMNCIFLVWLRDTSINFLRDKMDFRLEFGKLPDLRSHFHVLFVLMTATCTEDLQSKLFWKFGLSDALVISRLPDRHSIISAW